jgi:hypothetical protein
MYGSRSPISWKIDWSDKRQIEKIARQDKVAITWIKDAFPGKDPELVMNDFFTQISVN